MFKILLSILVKYVISTSSSINTFNTFTINSSNFEITDLKSFTEHDIKLYELEVDKSINIYTIFTKNYFSRCYQYNDIHCEYIFEDQERACKQILYDNDNDNDKFTMYYYGIYNYIPYENYLISYNEIYQIHMKDMVNYEILGVYLLENSNNELSNYKLNIDSHEPDNFYKQMMLYLIPEYNKTISCPYWIYREEN
jgi:hypothetical protein